jgi:hypothetical protein
MEGTIPICDHGKADLKEGLRGVARRMRDTIGGRLSGGLAERGREESPPRRTALD